MNDEISGITQHFERMSVPDNMKFVLFAMLLFLPVAANAQQGGYDLDAWFDHKHCSTHDSLFTQDYDNDRHRASIPIHLTKEDFMYLDSVAEAINLWSVGDSALQPQTGQYVEIIKPDPGRMSYYFKTPRHPEPKTILSWPKSALENQFEWGHAIRRIIERQPYYNTLPRPMNRE